MAKRIHQILKFTVGGSTITMKAHILIQLIGSEGKVSSLYKASLSYSLNTFCDVPSCFRTNYRELMVWQIFSETLLTFVTVLESSNFKGPPPKQKILCFFNFLIFWLLDTAFSHSDKGFVQSKCVLNTAEPPGLWLWFLCVWDLFLSFCNKITRL